MTLYIQPVIGHCFARSWLVFSPRTHWVALVHPGFLVIFVPSFPTAHSVAATRPTSTTSPHLPVLWLPHPLQTRRPDLLIPQSLPVNHLVDDLPSLPIIEILSFFRGTLVTASLFELLAFIPAKTDRVLLDQQQISYQG